jgi:hypothetical protein
LAWHDSNSRFWKNKGHNTLTTLIAVAKQAQHKQEELNDVHVDGKRCKHVLIYAELVAVLPSNDKLSVVYD